MSVAAYRLMKLDAYDTQIPIKSLSNIIIYAEIFNLITVFSDHLYATGIESASSSLPSSSSAVAFYGRLKDRMNRFTIITK